MRITIVKVFFFLFTVEKSHNRTVIVIDSFECSCLLNSLIDLGERDRYNSFLKPWKPPLQKKLYRNYTDKL